MALAQPAYAVSQDEILARLEALEKNNQKLAKENADLRERVHHVERTKAPAPVVVKAVEKDSRGNPVEHVGIAKPPAPDARPPLLAVGSFRINAPDRRRSSALISGTSPSKGNGDGAARSARLPPDSVRSATSAPQIQRSTRLSSMPKR